MATYIDTLKPGGIVIVNPLLSQTSQRLQCLLHSRLSSKLQCLQVLQSRCCKFPKGPKSRKVNKMTRQAKIGNARNSTQKGGWLASCWFWSLFSISFNLHFQCIMMMHNAGTTSSLRSPAMNPRTQSQTACTSEQAGQPPFTALVYLLLVVVVPLP